MAIQQKLINYLNQLLKHAHDSIKGYKDAARNLTEGSLKDFFIERAREKMVLRDALVEEIYRLEGKPIEAGSFLNLFQRSWKNFKTSLDHDNEKEIAKYCLEEEKKAIHDFGVLLRNPELVSADFFTVLEAQHDKNLAASKALIERIKA
ncbi:PA2169 family four-helix-bundle protein [Cyclobacterium xiamenense]|uniref:PA2169 family four-helix-bundle protein n=1 Tax=Cyclobacterium xiamenense TaxID=1297121 RepID=UPI0012B81CC2|nr:PA2169 family four-helix-bundle protein [Cyclobacterium xiamenense]